MQATAMSGLAQQLLKIEAARHPETDYLPEAAERVSVGFCSLFSKRFGLEGFRMLMSRALSMTAVRFPHLKAVTVESDGTLKSLRRNQGWQGQGGQIQPDSLEEDEAAVALIEGFLNLLATFIGDDLTRRILTTAWPALMTGDASDEESKKS